jgi:2-oxoglutarate dehydrogenase E2 component (dihydrolipoamide succinyltransferase)
MSERILVPVLGESVTEATVAKWLKNQGDIVKVDEAVVELETDKVNIEVPAPSSGKIEKISVKEGETVNVGALLGTIVESQSTNVDVNSEEKKYTPPTKKSENLKQEKNKIKLLQK